MRVQWSDRDLNSEISTRIIASGMIVPFSPYYPIAHALVSPLPDFFDLFEMSPVMFDATLSPSSSFIKDPTSDVPSLTERKPYQSRNV